MIDATYAAAMLLVEFIAFISVWGISLILLDRRHARELKAAYDRAEAAEAKCEEYEDLLDISFLDDYWPTMSDLPDGVDRFSQYPIAGEQIAP